MRNLIRNLALDLVRTNWSLFSSDLSFFFRTVTLHRGPFSQPSCALFLAKFLSLWKQGGNRMCSVLELGHSPHCTWLLPCICLSLSYLVCLPVFHSYFLVFYLVTCSLPCLPHATCFASPLPMCTHFTFSACILLTLLRGLGCVPILPAGCRWLLRKWQSKVVEKRRPSRGPCTAVTQKPSLLLDIRVFTFVTISPRAREVLGIWGGVLACRGFTLIYQLPIFPLFTL